MVGAMGDKQAVGAVFNSELQAGQAVRALDFWNRAQRPRPLGSMCVVARRRSGGARYAPYRMPRAGRGAARGLVVGLFVAGSLGIGAGAAMGAALDGTLALARHGADLLAALLGRGLGFDVDQAVALARSSPVAGAATLAVAFGLPGALAGALVGAVMGAFGHAGAGFPRSIRVTVAQQLRPGGAAVVAWTRAEMDEALAIELRRLGGEPRRELVPASRATTSAAASGQRSG
jgi:hypothetical protein